jgi:hypothetical protein
MCTIKELKAWLNRFDDDCIIEVVTAEERTYSYNSYHNICETEIILPDIKEDDISWGNSTFDTLEFADLHYEYNNPQATRIKRIILGRSDL